MLTIRPAPLPESVWENLDNTPYHMLPSRYMGPPTTISGAGYFQYFLPLMVILGDIIELHHARHHPRLAKLNNPLALSVIPDTIAGCEASLKHLAREVEFGNTTIGTLRDTDNLVAGQPIQTQDARRYGSDTPAVDDDTNTKRSQLRLVIAYSTHILHVLHVLFQGKWDAIRMLDDDDGWITTPPFLECASHAVDASEALSGILKLDPELTFMPYLFGIYLLHGSFILLLFADRMPQLGLNQSVEQACETIIRAHEVCVVTLSTEFQVFLRAFGHKHGVFADPKAFRKTSVV